MMVIGIKFEEANVDLKADKRVEIPSQTTCPNCGFPLWYVEEKNLHSYFCKKCDYKTQVLEVKKR